MGGKESSGQWRFDNPLRQKLQQTLFLQADAVRGDEYTMSEAHGMSRSFGHGLINLGAQRGDVVAVILPNMPEYAFVMFGVSEAALRVTTLNPTYTPSMHLFNIIYIIHYTTYCCRGD